MNIYFIGMCISMVVYLIIGMVVSRKVKDANDFYVAGRKAPVALIAGSMIASYTSTGMFMGDAAQCYDGAFTSIIIFAGMQSAGYIFGAVFFGRYLRRSSVLTIPEFFGKRFCSNKMRTLAAVTAIITMTVYLLSVMQGIGTLMFVVTGVNYNVCIVIALVVFTFITIISGSRGVLITDTLMASLFTAAILVASVYIAGHFGGWFSSVAQITAAPETSQFLSWSGIPSAIQSNYSTGTETVLWGLTYGVVWMSVCMVGPWQSSRYLMAKNEHVIVKSAPISAIGVFVLEFIVGMTAVFVNLAHPELESSSQVMIWASMNILPTLLGVILLTGVLSAGISSATTFLSLIGSSISNDIIKSSSKKSIRIGQISMAIVSAIVLALAVFNPPSIFWIMFLGGAIVASSWMPVAIASVFSKKVTKTGAYCGMLFGFLGCFALRLYASLAGVQLPVYLDPSIVGIVCNVVAMMIGNAFSKVTEEEKQARAEMFVIPEEEKEPGEIRKMFASVKASMFVGLVVVAIMAVLWVGPYLLNR